ncbi:hypothetical protein TMatcc_006480 [Talaromyces marneffei ATCC 18224]
MFRPFGDELTETVTPQILVYCDVDEERPGDRFVTIDSIGASDGGKGSDLDTGTCVADDNNATIKLPRIAMSTYGIIAGRRISGSRTPLFLRVARMETQSDKGPFVAKPMSAPINVAKLVKPID